MRGDDGTIPDDEIVTKIVRVKNIEAQRLVPALRPLMPEWAHLSASGSDNLILVDRYANVRRIEGLIKTLDRQDK